MTRVLKPDSRTNCNLQAVKIYLKIIIFKKANSQKIVLNKKKKKEIIEITLYLVIVSKRQLQTKSKGLFLRLVLKTQKHHFGIF